MSKKKYLKPEVGIIKFNNSDSNMVTDRPYLLSAANNNQYSLSNNSYGNHVTLHK